MSSRWFWQAACCTVFGFLFCPLSAPGQEATPPAIVPPAPLLPDRLNAPADSVPIPVAPPSAVWSLPDPAPANVPAAPASSFETGPFGNGMGREFRPSLLRADYRVVWYPDEPVRGQNTKFGSVREDFSATLPFWSDASNDFAGTVRVRNELFHTLAIIPNTGQPFPQDLWDVRLGGSYRHLFDNGWIGGATVSFGSSGDQPFANTRDFTAGVNAFLTVPQGEHNAWLFSLAYSTNSELPFPIPGVAYMWQPTDNFRMNIGVPFQLMYRPIDDLTLDFSYMLLRTVHARATYRLAPSMRVYVGYDWENEAYPLNDRPAELDRLFYYDQRLTTGVQYQLSRHATLDFSGGYTFDRFYFEGQNYTDKNNNSINIGNGAFLSLQFQTRW